MWLELSFIVSALSYWVIKLPMAPPWNMIVVVLNIVLWGITLVVFLVGFGGGIHSPLFGHP